MVGVGKGESEVARISAIDCLNGEVLIDTLVQPTQKSAPNCGSASESAQRNVRLVDHEMILHFIFEYGVHIPSQIGCVCEGPCVEPPRCLLKKTMYGKGPTGEASMA